MEITKFLKAKVTSFFRDWPISNISFEKVNALIDKANQQWDERNAQAVEAGEEELPRMLPLVRLKVSQGFCVVCF